MGFGDTMKMFREDFFSEKKPLIPLLQMPLAFLKANLNVLHFKKPSVPTHYKKKVSLQRHMIHYREQQIRG